MALVADFSLGGLLRLRRRQEDQAAGHLLRARSRASELAAQRTHVRESLLEQDGEVQSVETMHAISAARASTSSMLADLRGLAVEQDGEVERARSAHAKARADRMAIEKLEARHDAEQEATRLRQEQAALDEIGGRGAPGGGGAR